MQPALRAPDGARAARLVSRLSVISYSNVRDCSLASRAIHYKLGNYGHAVALPSLG
jgi:hypothetical protein